MDFLLEICVDSLQSALNAVEAGADRIELCSSLNEGGITPSHGLITMVRESLPVKVHALIRPRPGDFLYSSREFEIMKRDINICGECGLEGIVTGLLMADGKIDLERTRKLVGLAFPMAVTFHRAFDLCADPFLGLEDVISTGASRLLSSGYKCGAAEGAPLISKLVNLAGSRIIIMPGGGLNESNIEETARVTGAVEFHLSARKTKRSNMQFRRDGIAMGLVPDDGYSQKVADIQTINNIIKILKMI